MFAVVKKTEIDTFVKENNHNYRFNYFMGKLCGKRIEVEKIDNDCFKHITNEGFILHFHKSWLILEDEIKGCPFCGVIPKIEKGYKEYEMTIKHQRNCHLYQVDRDITYTSSKKKRLLDKWNKRV